MVESDVQKIADILAPLVKRRGSGWNLKRVHIIFFWKKSSTLRRNGQTEILFSIAFFQQEKYVPHCVKIKEFYSHYLLIKIPWIHHTAVCKLISRNIPRFYLQIVIMNFSFFHTVYLLHTTPAACNLMHFLVISRNSQKG